jgi:uncharacterized protein YecE (DUF72 family)
MSTGPEFAQPTLVSSRDAAAVPVVTAAPAEDWPHCRQPGLAPMHSAELGRRPRAVLWWATTIAGADHEVCTGGICSVAANQASMTAGIVRVGISGWTYAPWRGVFYPKGLKREHELEYAASHFRAIEINGTFYGMQRPDTFAHWAEQVPANFVFSVKAPRFITHIRRLRDIEVPLANFMASGLLRLGVHLGPILWQFPPNFRFDPARLEPFLRLLPRDTEAAAALGRKHDDKLLAPASLKIETDRPLRHAIEIRHESFCCRPFIDLLTAYDVALVCADSVAWPRLMDVTSDFVYCRLHGSEELYASGYDNEALEVWAHRIRAWAAGKEAPAGDRVGTQGRHRKRDVFIFFDNDLKVRAPANAMELIRRLRA